MNNSFAIDLFVKMTYSIAPKSYHPYTVGWIATLTEERVIVEEMLGEEYEEPVDINAQSGVHGNVFHATSFSGHDNIV